VCRSRLHHHPGACAHHTGLRRSSRFRHGPCADQGSL
jgi:hypothetical protein